MNQMVIASPSRPEFALNTFELKAQFLVNFPSRGDILFHIQALNTVKVQLHKTIVEY